VRGEGVHERHPLAAHADRGPVVGVEGPGHEDRADLEAREAVLVRAEPADVVRVLVGRDHEVEDAARGRLEVGHHLVEDARDLPRGMDAEVHEHVAVARRAGDGEQEAVAEAHPVHPDPHVGGAEPRHPQYPRWSDAKSARGDGPRSV
jgi:hypothetical protein